MASYSGPASNYPFSNFGLLTSNREADVGLCRPGLKASPSLACTGISLCQTIALQERGTLTMPSVIPRVRALPARRTFEPPLDHSLKGVETMVSKHTGVNEGIRH